MVGCFHRVVVDAIPGEAQGQGVLDVGAFEHFPHDIGADASDVLVAGKVLVVVGHVEWREVFRQQHDLVVAWQFCMGEGGEQQAKQQRARQITAHGLALLKCGESHADSTSTWDC